MYISLDALEMIAKMITLAIFGLIAVTVIPWDNNKRKPPCPPKKRRPF